MDFGYKKMITIFLIEFTLKIRDNADHISSDQQAFSLPYLPDGHKALLIQHHSVNVFSLQYNNEIFFWTGYPPMIFTHDR